MKLDEKNQKIVVFSLLGVLALVWFLVMGPLGGKKTTPPEGTTSQVEGEENELDELLKLLESYQQNQKKAANFTYQRSGRDPFHLIEKVEEGDGGDTEPSEPPVDWSNFQLKGILYDKEAPLAIIAYKGNDEMVREGTIIEGVRVKKIEADRIILEFEGKEHILTEEERKEVSPETEEKEEEEEEGK